MNNSLVSIIIPTFNRAHIISETLDSVMAQTYPYWECIVVDDGSTDTTDALLAEYCKKDARFKYYKRPNSMPKGGNICRNFGFVMACGDYIKWLDSDDLLSKEIIASQVYALSQSDNSLDVSTAKYNFFKDTVKGVQPLIKSINKSYKKGYDLIEDFGIHNTFLPPHSYLVHKNVLLKSGLWNEGLLINQDGEFFTRVLLNSNKVIHAKEGMVYYRFGYGNDNVSKVSSSDKANDIILSWILIDSYIKIYTKNNETIQYVENAKNSLLKIINDKSVLKQYEFFLERKRINFEWKKGFKFIKERLFLLKAK